MDDKEKIQSFGDMVDAAENLTRPWRRALALTNILWAAVMAAFILLAYLTPAEIETNQNQDFTNQTQTYTSSVTDGK